MKLKKITIRQSQDTIFYIKISEDEDLADYLEQIEEEVAYGGYDTENPRTEIVSDEEVGEAPKNGLLFELADGMISKL